MKPTILMLILGLSACGGRVSLGDNGRGSNDLAGSGADSGGQASDSGASMDSEPTESAISSKDLPRASVVQISTTGVKRTIVAYGDDCTVEDDGVVVGKASASACAQLWTAAFDGTTATRDDCGFDPASNPRVDVRLVTKDGVEYRKDETTYCHPGLPGIATHKALIVAVNSAELGP